MSWIQKLYETYENCQAAVGELNEENKVPLLPICHTTQKAHVEIVLDGEGNFKRAKIVPKEEARTIIPCTESSGGRTSGEAPHPLCDKLQYVAKDYREYGGEKSSYFNSYINQLEAWSKSEKAHTKVIIVHRYVNEGRVIKDLVENQIMQVDNRNQLHIVRPREKNDKKSLDIFDLLPGKKDKKTGELLKDNWQADAFIRWRVEIPNEPQSAVWTDKEVIDSWIRYSSLSSKVISLCYVTGNQANAADQHPAKLRNDGDKAKLISSNDLSGFTFRGRFTDAKQACDVSFDVSQKSHSALRWLLSRQGYKRGDQAVVAWATTGKEIPQPTDDPLSILGFDELPNDEATNVSTAQHLGIKLRNKIAGYHTDLGDTTDVIVMGLDSATPGRLSITFYRELTGSDYLDRIESWHKSCEWFHSYSYNKGSKRYLKFVGAPAPTNIAEAAYGNRIDDRLRKVTVERILPCIIDGQKIPRDIIESVVRRASNRIGIENWEKTLSIACSLYKHFKPQEEYSMALDPKRKTRDYLYGRLLAIADHLEGRALHKAGEKRDTNAARYMQQFADHPFKTWRQIELSLAPYIARLGGARYHKSLMDEVMCSFDPIEEFTNDKSLSGEFLIGFHCQRAKLWEKKDNDNNDTNSNTESTTNTQED